MKKTRVGLLTGQAKNAVLVETAIGRGHGQDIETIQRATGLHERAVYRALRALRRVLGDRLVRAREGYGVSVGLSSLDVARGDAEQTVDKQVRKTTYKN